MTVALAFSSGTSDTTTVRARSFILVIIVLALGAAFLCLGGAGLFWPHTLTGWMLWSLALLDSYALFRVYGWFYNRTRIDLIRVPAA